MRIRFEQQALEILPQKLQDLDRSIGRQPTIRQHAHFVPEIISTLLSQIMSIVGLLRG